MATVLRVFGVLLILFGLIGGISMIREIDWTSYEIAKRVYMQISTNPYAKQDYLIAQSVVNSQLGLGIAVILSGIISSLFFFALATIIDLLKKLANQSIQPLEQSTES